MALLPPEELLSALDYLPDVRLCGPGPFSSDERVVRAATLPLQHELTTPFLRVMDEVKLGLRYVFQTANDYTLVISGSGHAGMEAALVNVVERGETVVICVNGRWGDRSRNIAVRQGCDVRVIEKRPETVFSLDEIEQALVEHKPVAMVIVHGESSAGVLQPLAGLGPLCHRHNCLLLVDAVASLAAVPFFTDEWEIDVVYSGSQKGLVCPPGLAPITFSPRAMAKVESRKTQVQSYYFDVKEMGAFWGCGKTSERCYHYTGAVSLMYSLREGLAIIAEQGLENCWKKVKDNVERLWEGLESMGMKLIVVDKALRLPTVTSVLIPDGFPDWKAVIDLLNSKFKVQIDGGTGPTSGKVWRIGVLGKSCNPQDVDHVLRCFKEAFDEVNRTA